MPISPPLLPCHVMRMRIPGEARGRRRIDRKERDRQQEGNERHRADEPMNEGEENEENPYEGRNPQERN